MLQITSASVEYVRFSWGEEGGQPPSLPPHSPAGRGHLNNWKVASKHKVVHGDQMAPNQEPAYYDLNMPFFAQAQIFTLPLQTYRPTGGNRKWRAGF